MTLLRDFAVGYAIKNYFEKKSQQQQQQQQQGLYQPTHQPFNQQGPGPFQQDPYQQGPCQHPCQSSYALGSAQQQYDSRQSRPYQQSMTAGSDGNEPRDRGYSRDMPQDAKLTENCQAPDHVTRAPPPYQEKNRR